MSEFGANESIYKIDERTERKCEILDDMSKSGFEIALTEFGCEDEEIATMIERHQNNLDDQTVKFVILNLLDNLMISNILMKINVGYVLGLK